ncbi:MAG: hypothetical protein COU63_04005 [Candidatus Pacebacteria bacterium CG10_big_fil_rev_8_21_14_0_10_36_11]|nr:hypothetical protein [Candidatus Pacearchaeota archaeon]OIP74060.1 MAG: hypothetical protein AUK08_02280 [Candidatus Pacebacteria bacterium CG2_30_36_39]PIR64427.1 MAG: hypothetical protein COU63_04005 [Candidatus Pacebacteria bacterium CG10_big_fil_rev_8_21_14_0_10_36_11]PJC43170.1 MAG: hypothetical protein CO040_00555 [Candidatus Pacebacteria bacterium CG_4_9_14_0_2_um_filter_36_8]
MLSLSHGLTGAFIAAQLPSPILYGPLALASHYLEDWIPHWDVGTGLSTGKRTRLAAIFMGIIDLGIAFLAIKFFWGSPALANFHIWLGAFVGLLPDFLEAPKNFLHWEPKVLNPTNKFHEKFHHSIPSFIGIVPQLILWTVIFFLK